MNNEGTNTNTIPIVPDPSGGQTPPGSVPTGQTPTPHGQTPGGLPTTTSTTPTTTSRTSIDSLPPDIQGLIHELREEAKTLRLKSEAEQRSKQLAEEARMREQGEYKQLAERQETRLKELEPLETRLSTLTEVLATQIKEQIKEWPSEVKAFDPGKDAPIEERLAWVERARPLVARLVQQQQASTPGNSPSPRPLGGADASAAHVDELRRRYQETGKYAF